MTTDMTPTEGDIMTTTKVTPPVRAAAERIVRDALAARVATDPHAEWWRNWVWTIVDALIDAGMLAGHDPRPDVEDFAAALDLVPADALADAVADDTGVHVPVTGEDPGGALLAVLADLHDHFRALTARAGLRDPYGWHLHSADGDVVLTHACPGSRPDVGVRVAGGDAMPVAAIFAAITAHTCGEDR